MSENHETRIKLLEERCSPEQRSKDLCYSLSNGAGDIIRRIFQEEMQKAIESRVKPLIESMISTNTNKSNINNLSKKIRFLSKFGWLTISCLIGALTGFTGSFLISILG